MMRRSLLTRLASVPFFAVGATQAQTPTSPKKLKIMMKSAWGPDDPTRAAFPFIHGAVLAEAGHDVQIFLLAEATTLLRKSMVSAIFPVGWPPLSETLQKVVDKHIPVFA
jgi:predicted peroxiredoxin